MWTRLVDAQPGRGADGQTADIVTLLNSRDWLHRYAMAAADRRPDAERLRRYGEAALEQGTVTVANAEKGARNATLFREAVSLAELVGAEVLSQERVWRDLTRAARSAGLRSFEIRVALASAFRRGLRRPRLPR
jgi:hypothetical protein